jgi:hypothetical protein
MVGGVIVMNRQIFNSAGNYFSIAKAIPFPDE